MVCSYKTSFSACFCLPEQDQCLSVRTSASFDLNSLLAWTLSQVWILYGLIRLRLFSLLALCTSILHVCIHFFFFLHTFTNTHAFFAYFCKHTHAISFSDFSFLKLHSALFASLWLHITGHFCVPRPDKISCLNFNVG